MRIFGSFASTSKPSLEPDWLLELPARLATERSLRPRCALVDGILVCWGEGLAVGVDPNEGRIVYREKLGGWTPAGFEAGRLVLARGRHAGRLDAATGKVEPDEAAVARPERVAHDTPEVPEQDPRLEVADRLYRVRTETLCRVTRHWVEVTDMGTAPMRQEVASFTLRSDRLVLTDRGDGLVYGWVGMDAECPAGALVGGATGPVLVLRRRFPAWHEHSIPVDEPDLLGHGPAFLGVAILRPGEASPRGRELGTAPETWEGLGWRGGSTPPYMSAGWGARPVGIAGGRLVIELTELANGKPNSPSGLSPRLRYLAAFGAADLLGG